MNLLPNLDVHPGLIPADYQAGGTGTRHKVTGRRVIVLALAAAASAGDDYTITIQQHDAASGGNSKALNFTDVQYKAGTTIADATAWSRANQTAANTYVDATHGEDQNLYAIEFDAEALDIGGGYEWISADLDATPSNAKIAAILYLDYGLRVQKQPDAD